MKTQIETIVFLDPDFGSQHWEISYKQTSFFGIFDVSKKTVDRFER